MAAPAYDAFPLNVYGERHHLDKALGAAGYGIDDINAIVIGHLHLDHAGGLEHFRGKNIPIYARGSRSKSTTTPSRRRRTSARTCLST
jgi:glyoxylase-like metal-dependent hydrolase (beta-lactamase superfamily II)